MIGIHLQNVTVVKGDRTVVEDITADISPNSVTAIVGPNGAGKTSLLDAILGFSEWQGSIRFFNKTGEEKAKPRFGYVPQRFTLDRELPLTPVEFLAASRQRRPLWFGVKKKAREESMVYLTEVGAERVANNRMGSLSGGELQRVLLASALMRVPDILILDEPNAGVDAAGEELFCEVLEKARKKSGFTQVMVSHNLASVVAHAEKTILINRRLIAEGPPDMVLSAEALQAAYGVHVGIHLGSRNACAHCRLMEHRLPRPSGESKKTCSCGHVHK